MARITVFSTVESASINTLFTRVKTGEDLLRAVFIKVKIAKKFFVIDA
jgi:hypothetical protein